MVRAIDEVYVERAAGVVKRAAGLAEDVELRAERWVFDVRDLVAEVAVELEGAERRMIRAMSTDQAVWRNGERCVCGMYPCACAANYPEREALADAETVEALEEAVVDGD